MTARSPRPNRVTPLGDVVAVPLRGAWCGNRGILHKGTEVVRFHAGDLWITCALSFKDWRLPQWEPGHFTLLFFHDEAVSLAAGHRPCALCRRPAYNSYREAVAAMVGSHPPLARELDRALHAQRLYRGTHRRRLHDVPWADVPDGAFVVHEGCPALVSSDRLVPWTATGYGAAVPRPGYPTADVITPPTSLAALRGGYQPQVDPSAAAADPS